MSALSVPGRRPSVLSGVFVRLAPSDATWRGMRATYVVAALAWLATRVFVLLHQGAWPWMNFFVVETAAGMLGGDWNEAVRPALPALLAMPALAAGLDESTTIFGLYVLASALQFGAYLLLVRELFPNRVRDQVLALLFFLVVPINHSIHHWRNVPVVLSSTGLLLLGAHWLRLRRAGGQRAWSWPSVGLVLGSMLLGVGSRTEVLTFVGVVVVLSLLRYRQRVWRAAVLYAAAAVVVLAAQSTLVAVSRADPARGVRYQVHTFLDSTPSSWLTEDCRSYPSEQCRERDGWLYFGPRDMAEPLSGLILQHPWTTVAKTWRSGLDNLWELFGRNISTYPGIAWALLLALLLAPACRRALAHVRADAWIIAAGALAVTVLPPLAWAPPHAQYHLHSVVAVVIPLVPVLGALPHVSRGSLWQTGFFAASALLSAVRYTRYPGY